MSEQESYIQVTDLDFEYPDGTQALKDINLEIYKGEMIALIGQNGSGKTTLSKCLNGLYKPTRGNILVEGLNSKKSSIVQMVKRVGYVFQNPDHQLFNNNCWDEIAYGPRNIELSEDEVKERVEEAISVVGLPERYHSEHPFFLSKGLRQRVAIASILALRPQVIIVDEPTTGQDTKQSLEIMDFLQDLNETHGHTIIIITHDMPIVGKYARRVIAMAQARIMADGTTREVFTQADVLQKTFLAPPQITQLAQAGQELGFDAGTLTVEEMVEQYVQLAN
ncbi:MAG TPA: energy-coupling factor transporter ATPase [Chloroflexi bacterium]|nr:MAG: ABC transporter ATP-binding protein [Chloroflexota bacterium]HDN04844.1 energy-coupling factor transporter ATPase [Chloroflexota bacterium]